MPLRTSLLLLAMILSCSGCIDRKSHDTPVQISKLEFTYTTLLGIGHERGCTRRDPSDVIVIDGTYYVYYTKVIGRAPGYWGTIWCAKSPDGSTWDEVGEILGKGDAGAFDSQATFTPNIIRADDKYYLFYTGVKPTPGRTDGVFENNDTTDITAIGLAIADHPEGPFEPVTVDPVLQVSDRYGQFDSYRVDDASLLFRKGKYWLYYKGRSRKHGRTGPSSTQMGVAFSNQIEGPYEKYGKPILPNSHEVLIWPFQQGVCALASKSSTLEYAHDGIDFLTEQKSIKVADRPNAPGAFRPELTQLPASKRGMDWGISMVHNGDEAYLIRFDCKSEE